MTTRSWKSLTSVALFAVACSAVAAGCAVPTEPTGTAEPPISAPPAPPAPAAAPAKSNPVGTGEKVSVKIDNAKGGAVELPNGTTITIPPGAMPKGVDTITVTSAPEAAPSEYTASSPVYVFEPDGTVFLKPLKVSLPVTLPADADRSTLTILWSRASGAGFDIVPTEFAAVAGSSKDFLASAEVTHFSRGFCGLKFSTDPHPTKDPYAGN